MGQLFDDHHRIEERRSGAAPLIGHFDPHDAELEEAIDELFRHLRVAIHVVHERPDPLDGEFANALLEHLLFFGKDGERCARGEVDGLGGHEDGLRRIIAEV